MSMPRVEITATSIVALAAVVAVGFIGWKLYSKRKDIAQAVDPTSDKNLAYQGVNKVGEVLTGDKDFSLGGWIYDLVHPHAGEEAIAPTPLKGHDTDQLPAPATDADYGQGLPGFGLPL